MKSLLKQLAKDERGTTAVEYGLIVSLIVIASVGAFSAVADENDGKWTEVATKISESIGTNEED